MARVRFNHTYKDIISVENLLAAWREFLDGKRRRRDVAEFQLKLIDNILSLHMELAQGNYKHGQYKAFNINDPKPRRIHKASVRDRLLHHAIYRNLYPFFDRTFISDSYSCRLNKSTHRAIKRFISFSYETSRNHTRTCWVLKCDIRKFFASIDHEALFKILSKYIKDTDILNLLKNIILSFNSGREGRGLPLGNLTSQLLVNIYMNEFDLFMKHKLKVKHYIRFADDFVILSEDKDWLEDCIPQISKFLNKKLNLLLHPDKLFIKTLASGVDFLGWVHFFDYRVLRTSTKKRMLKKLSTKPTTETIASYKGMLSHGNASKLRDSF